MGGSFAKRSKLTRSLMSACSFGKMSVANDGSGTSEGRPSMDRELCSLFDRATAAQPARATVGRCGGSIAKVVVIKGSYSARAREPHASSKRAHDEASSNDHMGALSPSSLSGVPCFGTLLWSKQSLTVHTWSAPSELSLGSHNFRRFCRMNPTYCE
jgi:hypothetical protein